MSDTIVLSQLELSRRLGVKQPVLSDWFHDGTLPVKKRLSHSELQFDVDGLLALRVLVAARTLWGLPKRKSVEIMEIVREGLRQAQRADERLLLLVAEHPGRRYELHAVVSPDPIRLTSLGSAKKVSVFDLCKFRDLIAEDVDSFEEVEFEDAVAA